MPTSPEHREGQTTVATNSQRRYDYFIADLCAYSLLRKYKCNIVEERPAVKTAETTRISEPFLRSVG